MLIPNNLLNLTCLLLILFTQKVISKSTSSHKQYQSNESKYLYIQLVLINDHGIFKLFKHNPKAVYNMNINLVEAVDRLFAPLKIRVSLVDSITWTDYDRINFDVNANQTIFRFLDYRRRALLPSYANYLTILISVHHFGTIYGYSLRNSICDEYDSVGFVTYWDNSSYVSSIILAHEIGHTLGMLHDDDRCLCPAASCIMTSLIKTDLPRQWSSCSKAIVDFVKQKAFFSCIHNKPASFLFRSAIRSSTCNQINLLLIYCHVMIVLLINNF